MAVPIQDPKNKILEFCGDYYTKETPALVSDWNRGNNRRCFPVKVTEKNLYRRRCGDKERDNSSNSGDEGGHGMKMQPVQMTEPMNTCRYCDTEKENHNKATGY